MPLRIKRLRVAHRNYGLFEKRKSSEQNHGEAEIAGNAIAEKRNRGGVASDQTAPIPWIKRFERPDREIRDEEKHNGTGEAGDTDTPPGFSAADQPADGNSCEQAKIDDRLRKQEHLAVDRHAEDKVAQKHRQQRQRKSEF